MSLFDENIAGGHPFDGVQKMTPIDGLNHVFAVLTGEEFSNIKYQYERNKIDKEGLNGDIKYTIDIVQQFHPEVTIGLELVSRTYAQTFIRGPGGTPQREYPDENPIFKMYGLGWVVKPKEDGSI